MGELGTHPATERAGLVTLRLRDACASDLSRPSGLPRASWRGRNSATQTPEPRKGESSHQCSRTSISTMHWTSGSNGTQDHVCAVVRAWSVSPTTVRHEGEKGGRM